MLLERIDITGAVITADAMHTQRAHATCLAVRGAHLPVHRQRNQPGPFTQLASLPWRRQQRSTTQAAPRAYTLSRRSLS